MVRFLYSPLDHAILAVSESLGAIKMLSDLYGNTQVFLNIDDTLINSGLPYRDIQKSMVSGSVFISDAILQVLVSRHVGYQSYAPQELISIISTIMTEYEIKPIKDLPENKIRSLIGSGSINFSDGSRIVFDSKKSGAIDPHVAGQFEEFISFEH